MGAWGVEAFDNDEAQDWALGLPEARDLAILQRIFADVPAGDGDSVDSGQAILALAAAELVAALAGSAAHGLPALPSAWTTTDPALPPELPAEANRAVLRVHADSELRELWEESGSFAEWDAAVNGLLARLNAPAGEGSRHPSREGTALQARRFLDEIVPFDGYSPDSEVEDLIRHCAAGGEWNSAAARENLQLCWGAIVEETGSSDFAASSEARQAYLAGCRAILKAIMLEVFGEAPDSVNIG